MKNIKLVFLTFLATTLLMTFYQVGKFYLFKGEYTIWQSHIMTIFFTALISTIISLAMINWVEKIAKKQQEIELREARLRTLNITMHTVHHIVNNFLNRLLLIRLEAEEQGTISKEVLEKLENDIAQTSEKLVELSELQHPEDSGEFNKFLTS